jgi:hypothetical protein
MAASRRANREGPPNPAADTPLARHLGLAHVEDELATLADEVLRPHFGTERPTRASMLLLNLSTALRPRPVRARWREEWADETATPANASARMWSGIQTVRAYHS